MLKVTGIVLNGTIVLDEGTALPDGLKVTVTATDEAAPTIWQKLLKIAGTAKDLPSDASEQHDHYLYGTPKS